VFQEVGGLSWELEMEEVGSGGINDYIPRVPRRIRYPNLVLKRALYRNSPLVTWMSDTIQSYFVSPANPEGMITNISNIVQGGGKTADIFITLTDSEGNPIIKWEVTQAFPLKWNVSPFNAMESKFVMETLEFGYQSFRRVQ
jgi:phage tail-like protein